MHLAFALFTIALCLYPVLAIGATAGTSKWCSNPPTLDGVVSQGEWPDPPQLNMTKTRIYFMNDQKFLYLLVDLPDSTGNVSDNRVTQSYGDGMAVCVDLDSDGKKTPMVDFKYTWLMGQQTARAWPISDSGWTGGYTNTTSKIVWGFGPTPASSTPHRFFEVKLNLTEMRANPGDKIRLAFLAKSVTPSFIDRYPLGFDNTQSFPDFYELELGVETFYLVHYVATGNHTSITVPADEWINSGGSATGVFPSPVLNVAGTTKDTFLSDNRPLTITAPTTITGTYQASFGLEPILFYSLAGLAAVCAVVIVILLVRRGKARPSPPPPPPPA